MTIQSLYDYMNTPNIVARQHFLDNFDGDVLNPRWEEEDQSGTNTYQMADEIDGGFEIVTGSGSKGYSFQVFSDNAWRVTDPASNVVADGSLNEPAVAGQYLSTAAIVTDEMIWWFVGNDTGQEFVASVERTSILQPLRVLLISGRSAGLQTQGYPTFYKALKFWAIPP